MFRSGSTLLMRVLSKDPEIKNVYCEPLHGNIHKISKEMSHFAYFNENKDIIRKWSSAYSSKKICLPSYDEHTRLKKYLDEFTHNHSLTKFVRLPLRSGWISRQFPEPVIVNLIRDPRAFCNSMLKERNKDIFKPDCDWSAYQAEEWFNALSKNKKFHTDCEKIKKEAPYVKIMYLWKICVLEMFNAELESDNQRMLNIRYEDFINNPMRTLQPIYTLVGRKLPAEVLNEFKGEESKKSNERKWEKEISVKYIEEWTKLDIEKFMYAQQIVGLNNLMKATGYAKKEN